MFRSTLLFVNSKQGVITSKKHLNSLPWPCLATWRRSTPFRWQVNKRSLLKVSCLSQFESSLDHSETNLKLQLYFVHSYVRVHRWWYAVVDFSLFGRMAFHLLSRALLYTSGKIMTKIVNILRQLFVANWIIISVVSVVYYFCKSDVLCACADCRHYRIWYGKLSHRL